MVWTQQSFCQKSQPLENRSVAKAFSVFDQLRRFELRAFSVVLEAVNNEGTLNNIELRERFVSNHVDDETLGRCSYHAPQLAASSQTCVALANGAQLGGQHSRHGEGLARQSRELDLVGRSFRVNVDYGSHITRFQPVIGRSAVSTRHSCSLIMDIPPEDGGV